MITICQHSPYYFRDHHANTRRDRLSRHLAYTLRNADNCDAVWKPAEPNAASNSLADGHYPPGAPENPRSCPAGFSITKENEHGVQG